MWQSSFSLKTIYKYYKKIHTQYGGLLQDGRNKTWMGIQQEIEMILATLCYIKRNNQTLMLHRNKKPNDMHKDKWDGLGGKFEAGESPEDCVIREIREESGLAIQNPRLHGLLLFPNFFGNDWYVFVYTASEFSGDLTDSAEGTLKWIPDDELNSLNRWDSDPIFFEWIESGKFFSAKFIYDGDNKMKSYEVSLYP